MTDPSDSPADPYGDADPRRYSYGGPKREPRWLPTTTKFILAVALLFAVASQTLQLAYVAPTLKANADTNHELARANAIEKRQDACYDKFTARVTDGNVATNAANLAVSGTTAALITDLAVPTPERDPNVVSADIAAIKAAKERGVVALAVYDTANTDRTKYSDAGRPLPCPIP